MSTMQKGAILRKCLNTFVPHCRLEEVRLHLSVTLERTSGSIGIVDPRLKDVQAKER